jgi:hypothetical protein
LPLLLPFLVAVLNGQIPDDSLLPDRNEFGNPKIRSLLHAKTDHRQVRERREERKNRRRLGKSPSRACQGSHERDPWNPIRGRGLRTQGAGFYLRKRSEFAPSPLCMKKFPASRDVEN